MHLSTELSGLDINAAVTSALVSALPAALQSALPGALVPPSEPAQLLRSPPRKKAKDCDDDIPVDFI